MIACCSGSRVAPVVVDFGLQVVGWPWFAASDVRRSLREREDAVRASRLVGAGGNARPNFSRKEKAGIVVVRALRSLPNASDSQLLLVPQDIAASLRDIVTGRAVRNDP